MFVQSWQHLTIFYYNLNIESDQLSSNNRHFDISAIIILKADYYKFSFMLLTVFLLGPCQRLGAES